MIKRYAHRVDSRTGATPEREEVDDLPRLDPALALLPELRLEQIGVMAEEQLAQPRVAEQERRELLREDVVAARRRTTARPRARPRGFGGGGMRAER